MVAEMLQNNFYIILKYFNSIKINLYSVKYIFIMYQNKSVFNINFIRSK